MGIAQSCIPNSRHSTSVSIMRRYWWRLLRPVTLIRGVACPPITIPPTLKRWRIPCLLHRWEPTTFGPDFPLRSSTPPYATAYDGEEDNTANGGANTYDEGFVVLNPGSDFFYGRRTLTLTLCSLVRKIDR